MRVVTSQAAKDDLVEAETWWRENHGDAPEALADEIAAALAKLEHDAPVAPVFGKAAGLIVRRTHLPRTRRHLYFTIEADRVVILAVWGSVRGVRPRLRDRARRQ